MSFLGLQRETQPFVELSFPNENSGSIPIGAREDLIRYSPSGAEGPLMKRAWAWQEKILSKRVVQFTSCEVSWQCCETSSCECSAHQETGKPSVLTIAKGRDAYSQWHRLVYDYTRRNLTYISDRLPAMSGVASIIQTTISSDYLAGLWRNNLEFDLLWFCDPKQPLPRSVKWQDRETGELIKPPTWSWASVDGRIRFLFVGRLHPYITILNARCLLNGLNPFGEVRGGAITIRSRTFDASLQCEDPSNAGGYWLYLFDVRAYMKPDCLLRCRPPIYSPSEPNDGVERVFQEQDPVSLSTHEEHVDHGLHSIIHSMVKCVLGCRLKLKDGTVSTQFLIVSESPSVPGSFERIGWVSLLRHIPKKLLMSGRLETLTLV
jgi:hypothetical protein